MIPGIAIVGAGPTAIYTLDALLRHATAPFALTIFEEQEVAGRGTPYRPGWNDPAMLSNIASIEIPSIGLSLVEWLRSLSEDRLAKVGVDRDEIDERAFYPRLALGEYLHDRFDALVRRAADTGVAINLRTRSRVVDAAPDRSGYVLTVQPERGEAYRQTFDYLVIATGHQWPDDPEVRPGYFLSPWPASLLDTIPAGAVGIRGASLTAIDAAVVLAMRFGAFHGEGDTLRYQPHPATEAFHLTLMSRKGLLPEADFFHPIPYEPMRILTPAAVAAEIGAGSEQLLDRVFALFKRELRAADPAYADRVGLDGLDPEGFRDGYFADRIQTGVFAWARRNLEEAERNHATRTTAAWRYTILRAHEVIAPIVPHLDDRDFTRFNHFLKPVFVDDYATVPHDSIRRILALHDAGKLDVLALGERYRIDGQSGASGATVTGPDRCLHFPAFIEATGQRPLGIGEFPFPSLRRSGRVEDTAAGASDHAGRGIAVDDRFHPIAGGKVDDRLFCVGLPFLLGRHPFVQGITSSHDLGEIVGAELAAMLAEQSSKAVEGDARVTS